VGIYSCEAFDGQRGQDGRRPARRGAQSPRTAGPWAAQAATGADALLIDIRSEAQRARDGVVPGAVFVARNVLEWRCDPANPHRDARIDGRARRLILMCDEGCQSSLAAATLHELGLTRTTDLIGGFQAWRAAGLPLGRGG
jgi:rhodanese-related sulfurtransferase